MQRSIESFRFDVIEAAGKNQMDGGIVGRGEYKAFFANKKFVGYRNINARHNAVFAHSPCYFGLQFESSGHDLNAGDECPVEFQKFLSLDSLEDLKVFQDYEDYANQGVA